MRKIDYRKKAYQKLLAESRTGLAGRYKVQVINPDGSVANERPWANNLILDQGLNQVCDGTTNLGACFSRCAVGTGTTPTYTDSGAITVTISAGTATASAPFFSAGMVGMLLNANTGEQQYITAFTSTTVVSVGGSNSVVAQLFTVWAVNQVGLVTEVKRTNTYLTGVGNCGTTNNTGAATRVLKRTFDFTAEVAPQNYEELGWSYTSSAGNNLFSRVLITGGTVTVLASQQLRVIYELSVVISPAVSTGQTLSISGWPVAPATTTDGDYIANAQGFSSDFGGLSTVGTDGSTTSGGRTRCLEPWAGNTLYDVRLASGSTLPAFNAAYTGGTETSQSSATLSSYTPGNFYRDIVSLWQAANGNRTDIRGIVFIDQDQDIATFVFDEAQTKDNTHLLELTWRRYANRILVNP